MIQSTVKRNTLASQLDSAGASVITIQRNEETHANPEPNFTIESGDMLVAIGTREQQVALEELIRPDSSPA